MASRKNGKGGKLIVQARTRGSAGLPPISGSARRKEDAVSGRFNLHPSGHGISRVLITRLGSSSNRKFLIHGTSSSLDATEPKLTTTARIMAILVPPFPRRRRFFRVVVPWKRVDRNPRDGPESKLWRRLWGEICLRGSLDRRCLRFCKKSGWDRS